MDTIHIMNKMNKIALLLISFIITLSTNVFTQEIHSLEGQQLTQSEFAIKLVEAVGWDVGLSKNATPADYLEILKTKGIELVGGFQPEKIITKEEKAYLISKTLQIETEVGVSVQKDHARALITNIEGEVYIKYRDQNEWSKAERGMKLSENHYIRTGPKSSVDLNVGIAGKIKIKENSELLLKNLSTRVDGRTETICLYLAMGEMFVDVAHVSKNSSFVTQTPTATVGVRGTTYTVKVTTSATEVE